MTFLIIRITLSQICNKTSSICRSSFEFYTYFAILESLYKLVVIFLKLFIVHIMFYSDIVIIIKFLMEFVSTSLYLNHFKIIVND